MIDLERIVMQMDAQEEKRRDDELTLLLSQEYDGVQVDGQSAPDIKAPPFTDIARDVGVGSIRSCARKSGDKFESLRIPGESSKQPIPAALGRCGVEQAKADSIMTPSPWVKSLLPSVDPTDIEILKAIGDCRVFASPQCHRSLIDLRVGQALYVMQKEDYHVSFNLFLTNVPPALQMAPSAIETNRCFFLHLGVALGYHPFAVQFAFRLMAGRLLRRSESISPVAVDVLPTITQYAGLVDANALIFLWPAEMRDVRLCLVSNVNSHPILSVFYRKGANAAAFKDILVQCDGFHFTLLTPLTSSRAVDGFLDVLLVASRAARLVVQENEIDLDHDWSILEIVSAAMQH
jgi:hypothetical protein